MNATVGGDELPLREARDPSPVIAHAPPRGQDDGGAGGHVPRLQLLFPVAVVRAVGNEAKIDRRGAAAADGLALLLDRNERVEVVFGARPPVVGKARREQGVVHVGDFADGAWSLVAKRRATDDGGPLDP